MRSTGLTRDLTVNRTLRDAFNTTVASRGRSAPFRVIESHQGGPVHERRTYTVPEVAQVLGISRSSAYLCIRRGEIPALILGRRVVVSRAALERLLADGGPASTRLGPSSTTAQAQTE